MRKILYALLIAVSVMFGMHSASAQYYTWGSDAPLKWSTIRTPDVRMIYPDTAASLAQRTLFYVRTVQPDIGYGFRHGPMRIPFVLHPENFQSNGLVMYLPKRVEFLTSPAIDGYSMPWYKQLVAHEYRHAVQYNNLDRGVVRALSYILGQQGSTLGLLFMPIWALEGDATMSETMMSSFGRGMQPSFNMAYRAMGSVGRDRRNIDKWFCGSYREYIPDHYQLGYQICSYAYERYGENIWDKVVRYSVRNPYVVATTRVAMGKYYDTNVGELFRETFDTLEHYWDSLPPSEDSASPLTTLPEGDYTQYQWPLPLNDTTVVVVKSDMSHPSRLMRLDTRTGEEQIICHTGQLSTRPAMGSDRIWWTEYRRSKLFEQRVNSQLCYLDLADGRPRSVAGRRNALYPETMGVSGIAWVEYNPDGRYTVVVLDDAGERRRTMPERKEIHGLAWDNKTEALYVIVTDDDGMWLGRVDDKATLITVTQPAYITLSDLRARDGVLYFGSIASGKDEAHSYDLASGQQHRLTRSAYGAFAPMPSADGEEVIVTNYDRRGYSVAVQETKGVFTEVTPSVVPINMVNPPRKRWDVVNLDTVRFSGSDSVVQGQKFRTKRYRKIPNMVNIHSWMPVAFNPFDAVDEHNINLNLGITFLSQNLLSNTEAHASYGWNNSEGSLLRMGVRYFGLGVQLEFDAAYGGNQIFYPLTASQPRPSPDKYHSVGLTARLPLVFQQGYHTRQLSVAAGWSYSNGMVADLGRLEWADGKITNIQYIGYNAGLHKLSFDVGYSDYVRSSQRDFAPPWGYLLNAGYTVNPSNSHFSDLVSFYGKLYTPGFFAHNSLMVAANYQTSVGGYKFPGGYAPLNYRSARLIPRGFTSTDIVANNYVALSVDYQFPLCYPEGGIGSIVYIKRIRLNVGGDYAQFRDLSGGGVAQRRIWSAGGDVIVDFNLFRQPSSATSTLKLSLYRPSRGSLSFEAGLGLPF